MNSITEFRTKRLHVSATKKNVGMGADATRWHFWNKPSVPMRPSPGVSLGMHGKPKISKLSAHSLIWDVLPAPFHYRTRTDSSVIWICNFMTTPGKLTYVHGRVMRFVPGVPLRAYSAEKLRIYAGGERKVRLGMSCTLCSLQFHAAWKISKFLSRRVAASRSFISFISPLNTYVDSGSNKHSELGCPAGESSIRGKLFAKHPRSPRKL